MKFIFAADTDLIPYCMMANTCWRRYTRNNAVRYPYILWRVFLASRMNTMQKITDGIAVMIGKSVKSMGRLI